MSTFVRLTILALEAPKPKVTQISISERLYRFQNIVCYCQLLMEIKGDT